MEIRQARAGEHEAVLGLMTREQPHLDAAEIAPLFTDRTLAPICTTLVAEREGGLVGCAVVAQLTMDPPARCTGSLVVATTHRGQGIGSGLNGRLESVTPPGTIEIRSRVYDDDPRSLAVAEHWGYQLHHHSIYSRLEVGDAVAPDLPEGVTVTSHHDYRPPDIEAVDHMLDVSQTNPERATLGAFDLARLRDGVAQTETPLLVVTRVDGVPAALSTAIVLGDVAYIGYSGVDPAFRGRGLARLTKQALHVEVRAAGARTCVTGNEEHNTGIRRINAELGFRVDHGIWRISKTFEP
jgi:predicted N-acetyltransferase YhbS